MNGLVINHQHRELMGLLETAIQENLPSAELVVKHYFAEGTYTREAYLPKGTVATGKIHRHSCINILSKGKIILVTDEGRFELTAPASFVSGAGVKKAVFVEEDAVFLNVHAWNGPEDLELIEKMLIAPSYEALEGTCPGEQ
jgi:hypothetical protein